MFLGEPQESRYDWTFQILGFPVRVTWMFWAFSAAFGYTSTRGLHEYFTQIEIPSNFAILLIIWVLATFVSILVHELGHALAFRYFGIEASIVLYQMGGLAIPGAGMIWSRQGRRTQLSHANNLIISAAGPAIQILLAIVVGAIAYGCGIQVYAFDFIAGLLDINLPKQPAVTNAYAFCAVNFLVTSSIFWAILNLLPVYPLDGGQIARHIIGMVTRGDGLQEACTLGMIVGALAAYGMYQYLHSPFAALFFASLAISNYQMLQSNRGGFSW